jgi:hypothetical protein
VLCGGMDVVVVLEFRQREQVRPVVLSLVDEEPEILLQFLVHPFRLSVPLRVISRRSCQLNSKHSVKFLSEFRHELGSSIGYDFPW